MIVTPLVGALILFWMIDSRGVLGVGLQNLLDDPTLSLKASTPMMWVTLIVYGIWSSCPFAFVVYYAGYRPCHRILLNLQNWMVRAAGSKFGIADSSLSATDDLYGAD